MIRNISLAMDLRGLWFMWLLIFLPLFCGCIVISYTFLDARKNVRVWRGEFQFAVDSQCPHLDIDIVGGTGKVYLDAYREEYQWISADQTITCDGDGKTIQCSCRFFSSETTEGN